MVHVGQEIDPHFLWVLFDISFGKLSCIHWGGKKPQYVSYNIKCRTSIAPFIARMSIQECTNGVFIWFFLYYVYICYTSYNSYEGPLESIRHLYLYDRVAYWGSFIWNFEEGCDYDHTYIDDSSVQGSDKENCSVGEDNSNMCKDVHRDGIVAVCMLKMIYKKMWSCKVSLTHLGCSNWCIWKCWIALSI